jgi:DNA polymerase-3 subunit epsilon
VTFCVLDLETTGCDAGVDAITEIGAVKVRGGERIGTFHTLVNARQSIPTFIALLTGISDGMLADAPPVDLVLPSLLEFVRGSVVVGHNVRFDLRFINAALDAGGYEPLRDACVDTVPLARHLVRDEVPDCRLSTLAAVLGLHHVPTHRALDDAEATVELLHLLIERGTGYGVTALDDLLELPRLARHVHARKLPLTNHLPREPGVYLFHGGRDEVLHVGRADDVRQAVRRYFASRDRRRIAPLLRETRRISSLPMHDPIAAEVLELRVLQRERPRYDRSAVRSATTVGYLHVDPSGRRRPSITREPRATGVHVGPVPTRVMAQLALEALHELGDSGAVRAVTGTPTAALDELRDLAATRTSSGDRVGSARLMACARALAGALGRQQLTDEVRALGHCVVDTPAGGLELHHGLIAGTTTPSGARRPLAVGPPATAEWAGGDRPLPRWAAAEVVKVAKRVRSPDTRSSRCAVTVAWSA